MSWKYEPETQYEFGKQCWVQLSLFISMLVAWLRLHFVYRREDEYVHLLLKCENMWYHLLFKETVFVSEKTLLFSTEYFLQHWGFQWHMLRLQVLVHNMNPGACTPVPSFEIRLQEEVMIIVSSFVDDGESGLWSVQVHWLWCEL